MPVKNQPGPLTKYFALWTVIALFCLNYAVPARATADDSLYGVKARFNVKVPMRDGTLLSADIYLPDAQGTWPVLLMRTPYGNFNPQSGYWFAKRGYAVVLQDVRGKSDSYGEFNPFVNEALDGYDTQQWCGRQPWSNGKLATFGGSYVGATQWLTASLAAENLTCMFPVVAASDFYRHWIYSGGVFALSFNTMWGALSISARVGQNMEAEPINWKELFNVLPLSDIPAMLGRETPWYGQWLSHPRYDEYWKELSIARKYEQIKAPAFNVGGWYDIFLEGTLENFSGMRSRGGSQQAREGSRLVIGPWFHGSSGTEVGQLDFGPASIIDTRQLQIDWFDYWLKGKENGLLDRPPVRLFVMGENKWRDFQSWPPEGAEPTEYFLHSDKGANSSFGDGTLSTTPPAGKEKVDLFTYDPANPVPTLGGNDCCRENIVPEGPYDQRPLEYRDDILIFTGAELADPLTVIGPVEVKLWAASSAVNTDFTAMLVDVYPDGRAINITSGIIRAPMREGLDTWNELAPGKQYEFTITLRPSAVTFLPGHRIRLAISSSNFPRFARNLNTTGADIADKTEIVVARQQVFHSKGMASRIILPVLPVMK